MIISFDKYSINEEAKFLGFKTTLFNFTLLYWGIFSNLTSDINKTPIKTFGEVVDYVKTFDVRNNDKIVQEAVSDVKNKISNDNTILNKEYVINKIDSIVFVRKKNDRIIRQMYNNSNNDEKVETSSMAISMNKKKHGYDCDMIFLNGLADYNEIVHEIYHIVKKHSEYKNKMIFNAFDFSFNEKNVDEAIRRHRIISNFDYKKINYMTPDYLLYLKKPQEIYSRINSLKFYLYKNKDIKKITDPIPKNILKLILDGSYYRHLNSKQKYDFIRMDFIDALLFLNINKFDEINQYVQSDGVITKNLA